MLYYVQLCKSPIKFKLQYKINFTRFIWSSVISPDCQNDCNSFTIDWITASPLDSNTINTAYMRAHNKNAIFIYIFFFYNIRKILLNIISGVYWHGTQWVMWMVHRFIFSGKVFKSIFCGITQLSAVSKSEVSFLTGQPSTGLDSCTLHKDDCTWLQLCWSTPRL